MSDSISQINLWCQKNGKKFPSYQFDGHGTEWACLITAPWLESQNLWSQICSSKKEAKQEVAQQVVTTLSRLNRFVINLNHQPITLLIDGDQRMDCWRWLTDPNVIWDHNLTAIVYVSPTSPVIDSSPTRNIQIRKAKTTNRDSADAQILMDLGGFLVSPSNLQPDLNRNQTGRLFMPPTKYVIVSSDHILVQAAEDTPGVDWVPNQKGLFEYFSQLSEYFSQLSLAEN